MPYDPYATADTDDRSFAYQMLWLGLPMSILLIVGVLIGGDSILVTVSAGWVAGLFMGMIFASKQDEYVREQFGFASHWALSFAGLALFFQLPQLARILGSFSEYTSDPTLILACMALVFHSTLAFRRLKDR